MQRLRDTFRRRQNTLEAQAKAEATKIQQQQQQQQQQASSSSTSCRHQSSISRSPSHTGTGAATQSHASRSPTNSTTQTLDTDMIWMGEPSPPLSPAHRNETSLSFGSTSNATNEDIEEEDEDGDEEGDDFDLNMSALTLNDQSMLFRQQQQQYLSEFCAAAAAAAAAAENGGGGGGSSKKMCLEVPNCEGDTVGKQMRSASFDEIRSRELMMMSAAVAGGSPYKGVGGAGPVGNALSVPDARNTRSRSFDYAATGKSSTGSTNAAAAAAAVSATASKSTSTAESRKQQYRGNRTDSNASGGLLDVPKWKLFIRRPSSTSSQSSLNSTSEPATEYILFKDCVHCALMAELGLRNEPMLTPPPSDSFDSECSSYNEDDERTVLEAMDTSEGTITAAPSTSDLSKLPQLTTTGEQESSAVKPPVVAVDEFLIDEFIEPIEGLPIVTFCPPEADSPSREALDEDSGSGITVISLEVPVLAAGSKQGRSASVDSPYLLQVPKRTDIEVREGPPKARSKSVDIVLPTTAGGPYLIVPPLRQPPITTKKTIQGEIKIQAENGETRVLRSAPDWTESAINGDHLWVSSNTSGSDLCYVGERECLKTGPRLCCPVCKVIAHTGCISILIDKMKIHCKPTFKDGVRQYREQQIVKHHWVHRRHEKGRCKSCGKSFQSKLTFGGNKQEVVAVSCSWCKASYHNKAQCINEGTLTEACDFGNYAQIIVPPTWIVKLPRKGSFKSSIRRTPRNKRLSSKRRSKNKAADASSSSSCSLVVNSSASAAAVMAAASSSPNVLLVTGGGAGGQSSSERAKLSLNNGTLFSSSNNMGSSSGGGSSITIASSSLTSTSSPGSSPSPSSVILGLHQEGSGNGAGAGAGAASATLSVTPSPFLMGAHNGGNSSSGGGSSTTSPGGPSPSPPPLPPAPELPTHSFTPPPPPPPSGSAHSHYYSKHNSGQISEMSGGPAHLYGAMVPSPMGVGGGGGGGVGGGGSRRQYRRHSHAAVSASSLTSSGLLSAEGKDGGGGGLPYGHSVSTSHYLQTVHRSFTIKPIPSPNLKPLLVFINPKSGGNQGAKLMQKFQWHLNPRQVFDLSQGGPRLGLDLYKKVHNLRVLACGGDGTAGWVLSTIDEIGIVPPPPIAVLPLGTGNDLARSINWGASYTDEPVSKILCNIQDGEVVQLDRWNLKVQRNPHVSAAHSSGEEAKGAKPDLPLNVVNNYFSIGVDAHIALSFHEAREAHPERFNSRFKNRIFYGQAGSKDLMQRKWKDLSNYVKLVCDGVDYTSRLKELKVHSVLFLNIPSYSGGTRPWAPSSSYDPQSTNDGQIEVIGLTTYQLPLLQAGGHGTPIAQCQSARITTTRTIPMQVDGEPCKLLPSIIVLELRNKANLIAKTKSIALHRQMPTLEKITLKVRKLNLVDYETYHYDKERLRDLSTLLGSITIEQNLELIHVRTRVNDLMKEKGFSVVGAPEVCSVASSLAVAALGGGTGSNTSSPSKTAASLASVNLTTLPSTSFNSPVCVSSSSASSVSSKFVSNDWCFVDSCTAERFFRIDRAQEHLHYVVDICNEDLYILDPQFDESKDEAIDILTTEEVLTAAEVLCPDDVTDQGSVDQLSTDTTDQPSSGDQADAKPQLQSIDENSNLPGLLSLNNGNKLTSTSASSSAACDANKLSLPGLSATTSSTTANTNSNNSNNTSGNCLRPGSSTSDLDSVSSLAVSPADLTIGRHSFLSTSNHNGSIGSPSPLSPQPPSSPYTTCSIDSPPRSPRRGQKALSPQSYRLQDQLMSAAQTGDVGLLKNLHHQGVNLMGVDENRMTALHHAAMNGHESAVAFLLNAFTPDVVDLADRLRGQTALHHAVMAGHRNISTMLVIRGATLSAKDHQGRSALDLAHFLGRHDLALALSHLFTANNRETTV